MDLGTMNGWYIASMILFIIEAFGMPGIGAFFAAIGALCVGLFLQAGWLNEIDSISQFSLFFACTAVSAVILWKPIKKFNMREPREIHHDMIGRAAIVAGEGLTKGKPGIAQWSGTTMTARLSPNYKSDSVPAGTELTISAVEGLTIILGE